MAIRISNLRGISADSSVSVNDIRKIIFPTSSFANNSGGTVTLTFTGDGSGFTNLNASNLASGTLPAGRFPALTGDITTASGSLATTITNSAVTLAKIANIANASILGNNSGSSAAPIALTATQVKTLLAIASTDISGLGSLATLSAAPAGTLTGTTLNATVITSSLTSVGVLSSGSAASGFTIADTCLSSNIPLKNANNQFSVAQYITSGGLTSGNASAPKGTGTKKIEVYGTGSGSGAYGSIALSRPDGTSSTIVGSIDFYSTTTLAAQILCNQVAGGSGGTNYLSFNLGASGTMVTPMQLQYASGSVTGTLVLGLSNSTLQGKLTVYNYSHSAVTTGISLSNPVSSGATGSCAVTWTSSVGDSIGQIRGHYMAATGVGDVVIGVGTGATNGLQDLARFTATGTLDWWSLSSVKSRKNSSIQPGWKTSTDASRQGQLSLCAVGIVSTVETVETAITIWAQSNGGPIVRMFGETDIMSESYGFSQAEANRPFFKFEQYRTSPPGIRMSSWNRDTNAFNYSIINASSAGFGIGTGFATNNGDSLAAIGFTTTQTFVDCVGSNKFVFGRNYSGNTNMMLVTLGTTTGAADAFNIICKRYTDAVLANQPSLTLRARSFTFNIGGDDSITLIKTLDMNSTGGNPQMGFFGKTAISQPTASLVTLGYTAGASTTVTIDGKFTGNVGSTAYTIADIVAALKNLGLITQ